ELADAHALKAAKARVAPRAESPVRLAKATCASSDPGEALVCADSRLGARDRQLQQAYRSAEAAGVSPEALRRQQSRWLQARAAAAREDRWAVEDVYEARIAELKELSRDQN
ncbi:MAG TPA: lysozyme inhibitor LprI family protein, partial [Phenylobacterium sp.]|nr:lysozyme inhibitor LprI family protein [Phenylobacterium sp.]